MKIDQYIRRLKQYDNFVIWGAGSAGSEVLAFLKAEFGLCGIVFVDNNPSMWNTEKEDCRVVSPQEVCGLLERTANVRILIAARDNVVIGTQIRELGISMDQVEVDILGVIRNQYQCNAEDILTRDQSKIQAARALLQDARSVEIFDRILDYRRTGDSAFLKGLADLPQNQYFPQDLFTLGPQEVFVDCGSYTGDTLRGLLERTDGSIKSCYLFEPDRTALEQLRSYVGSQKNLNAHIYPCGCWHSNCDLPFSESGSWSSKVDPAGSGKISGVRVDDVVADTPITFVKMDIEGAEREALRGMERSICAHHPVLAISIYHKISDLYELPLQIHEMNDNYRLYIRCYAPNSDTEIVCYAL